MFNFNQISQKTHKFQNLNSATIKDEILYGLGFKCWLFNLLIIKKKEGR